MCVCAREYCVREWEGTGVRERELVSEREGMRERKRVRAINESTYRKKYHHSPCARTHYRRGIRPTYTAPLPPSTSSLSARALVVTSCLTRWFVFVVVVPSCLFRLRTRNLTARENLNNCRCVSCEKRLPIVVARCSTLLFVVVLCVENNVFTSSLSCAHHTYARTHTKTTARASRRHLQQLSPVRNNSQIQFRPSVRVFHFFFVFYLFNFFSFILFAVTDLLY